MTSLMWLSDLPQEELFLDELSPFCFISPLVVEGQLITFLLNPQTFKCDPLRLPLSASAVIKP